MVLETTWAFGRQVGLGSLDCLSSEAKVFQGLPKKLSQLTEHLQIKVMY